MCHISEPKRSLKFNGFLDGAFKNFLFSHLPGEMIQFDSYFSRGLVQPPTSFYRDMFWVVKIKTPNWDAVKHLQTRTHWDLMVDS